MSLMPDAPDILWFVTTQWRAQACGYAGDPNARTPHLDALAARSVNYAQAVTPHPFSPFARAALLTGVPSPENGVRDYFDALPSEARTIAHRMKERGYATAFFGKWGVGARDAAAPLVGEAAARQPVPGGARGGFDFWEGFEGGFLLNDPWLQGGADEARSGWRAQGYQSEVVAGRALAWWQAQDAAGNARPRFALVSVEAPHPPYAAAVPEGISRLRPEDVVLAGNVPRGGAIEARARADLAGYFAHIEATDRALGGFVAALDEQARRMGREEPVVVFTSVHGDMHGAHGLFRKGWPHEESVRVPLLVCGAPGGAAGTCSEAAVSLLDLPAMTEAWSEGRAWVCPRERAEISMPSVVKLPDQCDRVWSGWRSATEKRVYLGDGEEWRLAEQNGT